MLLLTSLPVIARVSLSHLVVSLSFFFFFFNDTATTEIYTLSLHDALPICRATKWFCGSAYSRRRARRARSHRSSTPRSRSEEHTSELQSPCNLVCRLLLEKKKKTTVQQHMWLERSSVRITSQRR